MGKQFWFVGGPLQKKLFQIAASLDYFGAHG